ncbi:serine threonine-protein kinase Csk1 [Zalerion maritima]|uniref:cyclin-dependent kinase n=1 Tax=Zalerion maritima TaxID=339359 RepID=A0AAD5WMW5_9PEZI|nr:serine threonine-protein kinase Csk1 [Zalerion maritima]
MEHGPLSASAPQFYGFAQIGTDNSSGENDTDCLRNDPALDRLPLQLSVYPPALNHAILPSLAPVLTTVFAAMAGPDWRSSLPSALRFENIDKIKNALESGGSASASGEAYSFEGEVYKTSKSRDEYEEKCRALSQEISDMSPGESRLPPRPESPGQTIGPFKKCHHIGEGITSQVFRANDRALKVIVETNNIEPHDPIREAKILETLRRPCIPLLETFRDQEQRFVLVFPYMPLTLGDVLERGEELPHDLVRSLFLDIFHALEQIHEQGIIHRDIKPSAILLESAAGPALLSDFGTAWHPAMSLVTEPANNKILDVGTGPYRAPEVLFGKKSYGPPADMWGVGALLAECCRKPQPKPLFDSPPTHEDGSQLGLILSIFKTVGSPTRHTWPEAAGFKTPPFEMYRFFDHRPWTDVLPEIDPGFCDLVAALVRYDTASRATAGEASSLTLRQRI